MTRLLEFRNLLRGALAVAVVAAAACQSERDAGEDASAAAADGGGEPAAASESEPAPSAAGTAAPTADTGREPIEHSLSPLPGNEDRAPVLTRAERVRLDTTAGAVTIEVYPEAAPNAAQRFLELVSSGYYDGTPVSRVVPGFVAQFGINWREPHREWRNRTFDDDPSLFSLDPGTLAFAKRGPNTNSTQVFINYSQNDRLAVPQYNFTVFGKVVDGMDAVQRFVQVGDPSNGLDQERLWNDGAALLESLRTKPTMIERAVVL